MSFLSMCRISRSSRSPSNTKTLSAKRHELSQPILEPLENRVLLSDTPNVSIISWSQFNNPTPTIVEGRTARGGFGIRRDGDLRHPLTVNYQIANDSIADGDDHSLSQSGSVTIKRGRQGVRLPVDARVDTIVEGDETLIVGIASGEGYNIGGPSSATLIIGDANSLPIIRVEANKPQTAEGGSESGQFTFYRDGDDSRDVTIGYILASGSGQATPGDDYTPLSGSITIPAGQPSATIDVTALADTDPSESNETVTITLGEDADQYMLDPNAKTATVNVLNKKAYLVAFYGAGPSPLFSGNNWFERLSNDVANANDYRLILKGENDGRGALSDFLSAINADGNRIISKAEVESAEVRALGYSFGGVQAINFTYNLNRVGSRIASYKLEVPVEIEKLVTIDSNPFPFLKAYKGSVQANVASHINYYERTGVTSVMNLFDPAGNPSGLQLTYGGFNALIKGDPIDTATQFRVDTLWANDSVTRLASIDGNGVNYTATLFGNEVNHGTIIWYVYDRVKADLG